MAVNLHVDNTAVGLRVAEPDRVRLSASEAFPVVPGTYDGPYTVTPERVTVVLNTANKMMTTNVVVNPIPSNYGLITYDGSTITVS